MKRMRGIGLVLAIMMALATLSGAASATGSGCTLRVRYEHEGTAIGNAGFRLYHVATGEAARGLVPAEGFKLTTAFAGSGVSAAGPDQAAWREQALTLAGYAAANSVAPVATGTTDGSGLLTLATGLEPGLYLLLGDRVEQGGYAYSVTPNLIAVSVEDQGESLEIKPKHERLGKGPMSLKVVKVWEEKGLERPASVEAVLLKDGVVEATAVLNAGNAWSHTWTGLNSSYPWSVAERAVPKGYRVKVEQIDASNWRIVNTGQPCLFDPPVKKNITGDKPSVDATFRFVMEAVSNTAGYAVSGMPMPEGSNSGKKTHDQKGAGWFEFGDVLLTKAGEYVYRLYEDTTTKSAGYTYDETVYTLKVTATETDGILSAKCEVQKSGETTAKEVELKGSAGYMFEFTNPYKKTSTPPVTLSPTPTNGGGGGGGGKLPQTGQLWWPVPVLALAGIAFLVVGLRRRRAGK